MKNNKNQKRQGDVLLMRVENIPSTAKKCAPENGRIILARGEATGHHHSIDCDKADWWKDEEGTQYVSIREMTALEHQEHDPISLEVDEKHRVFRQREYTPEAVRNVAD